ncbi:MAG TPA: inositol monophosphatase family protein [Euzebyales bacterium]|nr:inositol monophosphatase family protein [Euzebyales bacterium]
MTEDTTRAAGERAALLRLAVDIAREAGALLRSYADSDDLHVATKSTATDPVSAADHASERLISERVRAARPDDGLMGEEQEGDREGSTGLRWVVDPLDGTVNYLYGIPQWSVSIAVEDADGPLVGVVHDPSRDDLFTAIRGGGARLNDTPLRLDPPTDVSDALIATGFSYDPAVRGRQAEMLTGLITTVRDVRRLGSAALDLAWLAAGRCDGYVEFALHRWDYSAGSLLVTEAGGIVAAWELAFGDDVRKGLSAGGERVSDHLAAWLEAAGAHRIPLEAFVE